MSDDALAQIDANGEDNSPAIGLIAQYIKDLSFENPNAPAVYQWQGQPQIDGQFNIGVQVAGANVHEVVLNINVRASSADKVAYQVELAFAGLFGARNIPEDQLQAFMLIDAPALLFPFARRVVADAIRDGSFPPLLLDPIDFRALYLQQAEAAQGEPQGNA